MGQDSPPLVALVGRPNVGKSALFNRLLGQRVAIVEDIPGTTRDRLYGELEWGGREMMVVDTGGLETAPSSDMARRVGEQVRVALDEADVIVFVVDAKDGPIAADLEIADMLRRADKPLVLAANKGESARRRFDAADFYVLGLGEPLPVSALHGTGLGDLLDEVVARLPERGARAEAVEATRLAIVGRQNVGKSSLVNTILGQERVIVSAQPGTTRDAIDTSFDYDGTQMVLIDTAGIRRRGRVAAGVERYSVDRALRALDRADVAVLVLDGAEGVTAQDTHVAGYIAESLRGVVIAANKTDLLNGEQRALLVRRLRDAFRFMSHAPVVLVSAVTGEGIPDLLAATARVRAEGLRRIPTPVVNTFLREAAGERPPPARAGRRLRLKYLTQTGTAPPTFVLFVNDASLLHFSYRRYLENSLRRRFGFAGNPIRMVIKSRGED